MAAKPRSTLVVDTSSIVAVLVNEPTRALVMQVTKGITALAAPSLPWEVGNALVALGRRQLLSAEQVSVAWLAFEQIPLRYVDIDMPQALKLASEHSLYAYDSYVLAVAEKTRAPLLSFDRRQKQVAKAMGLALLEVTG